MRRDRIAIGPLHLPTLAAVAVGGAAGTCARVGLSDAWPAGGRFPWATWTVNLTGSLVLGLVIGLLATRTAPNRLVRPLLGTGVCGGYTTFSTLVVDADLLVHHGHAATAAAYVAATAVGGLAAVVGGLRLARLAGPREA